jgi:hypothetical protein
MPKQPGKTSYERSRGRRHDPREGWAVYVLPARAIFMRGKAPSERYSYPKDRTIVGKQTGTLVLFYERERTHVYQCRVDDMRVTKLPNPVPLCFNCKAAPATLDQMYCSLACGYSQGMGATTDYEWCEPCGEWIYLRDTYHRHNPDGSVEDQERETREEDE